MANSLKLHEVYTHFPPHLTHTIATRICRCWCRWSDEAVWQNFNTKCWFRLYRCFRAYILYPTEATVLAYEW